MMSEKSEPGSSGLSFKFAKSREKKTLVRSAIEERAAEANNSAEAEAEGISGDFLPAKKSGKEELVIPLITKNEWRVEELKEKDAVKAELVRLEESELERAAKEALLKEGKDVAEGVNETKEAAPVVPLLYANQVPLEMETESRLDVRLRPDVSAEADYEAVPIQDYGMAMLRGMGWDESKGIGRSHAAHVKQKIPQLRPKGLGLGADKSLVQALKGKKTSSEALQKHAAEDAPATLKVGSHVQVTSRGANQGLYGQLVSFDEDSGRAMVKMSLGGATASVSLLALRGVGKAEFERESRCINKSKYDSFKEAEQRKHADHVVDEAPLDIRDGNFSAQGRKGKAKKAKREARSRSPKFLEEIKAPGWLRADLKVRIVDPEHKQSLEKVRVVDVLAAGVCTAVTESGKLLEGLRESQLETVIPRGDGPLHVLLIRGPHKGEAALIVDKDKKRQTATLQLLREQERVLTAHFDDICQFQGDLSIYES